MTNISESEITHSRSRPTLVFDSSPLMRLLTDLDAELPADKVGAKFIDVLPHLTGRNMRLIVPEMVALETANILHDLRSIKAPFDRQSRDSAHYIQRGRLLSALVKAGHVEILPAPRDSKMPHAGLCRDIAGVLDARQLTRAAVCGSLSRLWKCRLPGWGEAAALELMVSMPPSSEMFLVTTDADAARMAQASGFKVLSTLGMLRGMESSGLLRELGFKWGVDQVAHHVRGLQALRGLGGLDSDDLQDFKVLLLRERQQTRPVQDVAPISADRPVAGGVGRSRFNKRYAGWPTPGED